MVRPAARKFFDGIYAVLQNRQEHCAVVIPERKQRGFRSALLHFAQEGYGDIRIATLNPDLKLLHNLKGEFCETNSKVSNVRQFTERHLREGQFLALAFPGNSDQWPKEYREYLNWSAAEAKRHKDSGEPLNWTLLCILPPGHGFKADSGMQIMEWWGRRYPSDLEFVIEQALLPQRLGRAAYTWLYSICRGLGNAAPELVEYLAHQRVIDMKSIIGALAKHELCNQEIAKLAQKYGGAKCDRGTPPTGGALELWRAGALDIGCLGESLLHPAVLVACNFKRRLASLIVAGQMQVYLPMAQQVFHMLMDRMRGRFGSDWLNFEGEKPDGIGKLAWALNNYYADRAEEETRLANYWKDVRNNIAHAKVIPFKLALAAVGEYEKMLDG